MQIDDKEKIFEAKSIKEDNEIVANNHAIGLLNKLKNSFLSFCHGGVRVKISHLEL